VSGPAISEKLSQLLDEFPELRQYLEEMRRADHARAVSSDRLLGYEPRGTVACPECGHTFDPKKARPK
jgi:transposase